MPHSATRIAESELILNPDGSVYHLSLRPEHLTDTIITVGDPNRVAKVSAHFDHIELEINKREFVSHIGTYRGKRLLAMSTGMGTDNIEILMTELDALANIDLDRRVPKEAHRSLNIIRIGTSGAMQPELGTGTHLLSGMGIGLDTLMAFYDLPQTPQEAAVSDALQAATALPFRPYAVSADAGLLRALTQEGMVVGNTVTCPGFYAPQGRQLRLPLARPTLLDDLAAFGACRLTNFEMETAGYYAMARLLGHRALSANAIVANRANQTFSTDAGRDVDLLIEKVLQGIAAMP
jgi:uridine phosphorylase